MQIFIVHSEKNQIFGAYQTINQAMKTAQDIETNFKIECLITETTLQKNR